LGFYEHFEAEARKKERKREMQAFADKNRRANERMLNRVNRRNNNSKGGGITLNGILAVIGFIALLYFFFG